MDPAHQQLIDQWSVCEITYQEFRDRFPAALLDNPDFVRSQLEQALASGSEDELEYAVQLMLLSQGDDFIDLKNRLLVTPGHWHHQEIAKDLQKLGDPSTTAYVAQALASGFDYLAYTCSESRAIAKWFSWLLFSVGTPEAIHLMREYSESGDGGIREEMLYRLAKVDRR